MRRKIRIVHVINSFQFGGAEAMLCNLLLRSDRDRFDLNVVSLIDTMTVVGPIIDAGIPVAKMGMKPGIPDPRGVLRLSAHLRRLRPDVVQTWMDHSNLIGGIAAQFAPKSHLVWGIHHSHHIPGVAKRTTLATVRACAMLSHRMPSAVVFCSESARQIYERDGFDENKSVVIPNGFDTSRFQPDPAARKAIREEIGIDQDTPLIGIAARYDPCKDHATFIKAAAVLVRRRPEVRFLLCGIGMDHQNEAIVSQLHSLGLMDHFRLLGPRKDINRIYNALTITAQASISEAFPLALGESMACGTPCVATDTGDTALIVNGTGRVVPKRDPEALASALFDVLALPQDQRKQLGADARQRVCDLFDLGAVTRRYETLYKQLAEGRGPKGPSKISSGSQARVSGGETREVAAASVVSAECANVGQ